MRFTGRACRCVFDVLFIAGACLKHALISTFTISLLAVTRGTFGKWLSQVSNEAYYSTNAVRACCFRGYIHVAQQRSIALVKNYSSHIGIWCHVMRIL